VARAPQRSSRAARAASVADIDRLIVRAPNWVGDAVMALPALAAFRRRYQGSTLVVAAIPSVAPLFAEQTPAGPDEILQIDPRREVAQLREAGASAIVLLPNSFGSAWIASRSGIGERWGYASGGRGWLLTRSIRRPGGTRHQVQYYLELARGLGLDAPDARPHLEARRSTLDQADAILLESGIERGRRIVGFAPGAAYGYAKRWPPDRVTAVIAHLSQRGLTAVLVGAAGDRATGRAIESSLPPGASMVNLIGRTTMQQLVGVTARCTAFVSNDSGAMHIAAALGVPLTAIFGPTDERVTAPASHAPSDVILRDVFCRPCLLRECPIDHRCMKRIDVDAVLQSVTAHLA
jgi:heptosyltransferase-2